MTRSLVIALLLIPLSCARATPEPRVCETTPARPKEPTVIGMCTLDAPQTGTGVVEQTSTAHDDDAGTHDEDATAAASQSIAP